LSLAFGYCLCGAGLPYGRAHKEDERAQPPAASVIWKCLCGRAYTYEKGVFSLCFNPSATEPVADDPLSIEERLEYAGPVAQPRFCLAEICPDGTQVVRDHSLRGRFAGSFNLDDAEELLAFLNLGVSVREPAGMNPPDQAVEPASTPERWWNQVLAAAHAVAGAVGVERTAVVKALYPFWPQAVEPLATTPSGPDTLLVVEKTTTPEGSAPGAPSHYFCGPKRATKAEAQEDMRLFRRALEADTAPTADSVEWENAAAERPLILFEDEPEKPVDVASGRCLGGEWGEGERCDLDTGTGEVRS